MAIGFSVPALSLCHCWPWSASHVICLYESLTWLWKPNISVVSLHDIVLIGEHNSNAYPDNKVHGANMGPIWGREVPHGPHVGPMNFAIWVWPQCPDNEVTPPLYWPIILMVQDLIKQQLWLVQFMVNDTMSVRIKQFRFMCFLMEPPKSIILT